MTVKEKEDKLTTLRRIAGEVLDESDFDRESAHRRLKRKLSEERLGDLLEQWAIETLLEDAMRNRRTRVFSRVVDSVTTIPRDDGASSMAYADLLMDQEVRPGLRLRDAKKEDLLEKSVQLLDHARGTARHAYYLKMIANRLRPGEKVGDTLTDTDLKQILILASKKADGIL